MGETTGNAGLYRFVWRWHFYAGIIFAPILVLLAITGTVYLFRPYVEPMLDRELHYVKQGEAELAPSLQLKAVTDAYPDASITSYTDKPESNRATEIGISQSDGAYTVFVDPYKAKVLGHLKNDKRLMEIIVLLHGEIMVGQYGDYLVELAASWAIILMMTGLYLYWPRNKQTFLDVWRIRFRQGGRVFWRDLHASIGFWMTIALLLLILTGLPWAGSFGERLSSISQGWSNAPANLYDAQSDKVAKDVAKTTWAAENLPMPESVYANTGMLPIENIVKVADDIGIHPGYTVNMPEGDTGVYLISTWGWAADSVRNYATVDIDQYSGEVIADYRWKDYSAFDKMIELGIALHEGRLFGWINLLGCVIACLSLILIVASGITMWWKRRPKGTVGVPKKFEGYRVSIGVVVITVALGVLMPLVGMTMLAAFAIDLAVKLGKRLRPTS